MGVVTISREQWGHGYWKGVEDAQNGKVRSNFPDEVKYWIANMCCSNYRKDYDQSLFPVVEWIHYASFCGLSEKYAKKVYDYILNHNYYDFEPNTSYWCYVSGDYRNPWYEDYFVLPIGCKTLKEWEDTVDSLQEQLLSKKPP